ncbi:FG-GAP repeat domain-containing protein [Halosimplex amylolyticum]|uniref:FG-GAP repeat domain-containing protein n=1 Tax=Halosimplex amylolyticum TaxID=3396616 RepID=UPI003F571875
MEFSHERIDDAPPAGRMSFCLTEDLTGNGRPDVLVGALGTNRWVDVPVVGGTVNLRELPVTRSWTARAETNVFWYENPGWERHDVARAPRLSVGGALGDLTGNGRVDLVAGQNLATDLCWFEQPDDPRRPWTRRLVTDDFEKYHDVTVADVDDDGRPEVVFLSQESAVVGYYDVPDDPRQEPWPRRNRQIVAENLNVEGVAVTDVDGDGRTELVAGTNVFRRSERGWERESLAEGWDWTRVAAADLDGDGLQELVVTEGDVPYADDRPARLGVFDPLEWDLTLLEDDLYNPHTVQTADFDGSGHPDIYVAEMGLDGYDDPVHRVYRNPGDGSLDFEGTVVERGVPTHEAKAVDLTGDGRPDVVGKGYADTHVDVWYNETEPADGLSNAAESSPSETPS